MILKKKGMTNIIQCEDGVEAIATVQQYGLEYFDVIFMDSVMPKLCGPDTARKLRELGYSNLLLGVTGNALDVDVRDFETAGADAIFIKPLKAEYLDRVLAYIAEYGSASEVLCLEHSKKDVLSTDEQLESRLKSFIFY
jgi:CheY-like chemotaxis protein